MVESKIVLYLFMSGMLFFGTANTISGKAIDLTNSQGKPFNHPYFQTAVSFLGELFCLLYYFIYKKTLKNDMKTEPLNNKTQSKTCLDKMGFFVFMIPSFFDFFASSLMLLGLTLTAPSVYQMMRGFIMVVVALYSVIFLKIKIFPHQILGVALAFIGIALVGLASVLFGASSAKSPVLGAIIIIAAQFFAGGMFVSEQLFLENLVIHPLQAVGIEGLTGFGYFLIILPIFNMIPCSNPDLCSDGYIENSVTAFEQIGASWQLSLLFVGFMLSISLFNFTGVTTTKKAGALARSTIDTSRTVLIWIFSIFVGWEIFLWLQLIGFFFLVLGTLVYNEILKIPWVGLTESIERKKIYMKNRDEQKHQVKQDEFIGFSPGGVYDQTHFKHKLREGDDMEFR